MGVRVRQRKDDPSRAWWVYVTSKGRRTARSFGPGKTAKSLAEKEATQLRAQIARGQAAAIFAKPIPVEPVSFADLADEALTHYEGLMSLRESTRRHHRSFLVHHLLPYFGARPVSPATFSELGVERFIADRRRVLSDSTLAVGLPTLKIILRHAVRRGLLVTNPMTGDSALWKKKPPEPVEPFTSLELRAVLTAAYGLSADFGAYVQTMAQTGLRPGEGLALRRRDVDLSTGLVSVTGTWLRGQRGSTKNPSSQRAVSLLHPVAEDSPEWRPASASDGTRRVLESLAVIVLALPDADSRIWPMTSRQVDKWWTQTLVKAGLAYHKPHALRHSWISILLSRSAPLLYLVKAGGWANATTPLRTYAKWVPSDADGAILTGSAPPVQQAGSVDLGQPITTR